MIKKKKTETVAAYLAKVPAGERKVLAALRQTIKSVSPKIEERVYYHLPGYFYHGFLVAMAAFKSHSSFVTARAALIKKYQKELAGFKISGTTIHFSAKNPLPAAIVKKIVKERMKENESKGKK